MKIYVAESFSNGTGDIDYVGTNREKALAKATSQWNHYTTSEKKAGAYVLVGTATLDIDEGATPQEIEEAYNELLWNTNDDLKEDTIYYRDWKEEESERKEKEAISFFEQQLDDWKYDNSEEAEGMIFGEPQHAGDRVVVTAKKGNDEYLIYLFDGDSEIHVMPKRS